MRNTHRALSETEISSLEAGGSWSSSWDKVYVLKDFDPGRVRGCQFSGEVYLGTFQGMVESYGGINRKTGLYDAVIHDCVIGNEVFISGIHGYIANYDIGDNVLIEDVKLLAVQGPSSFGNGVKATVINEAGGREVIIYDYLSSHVAYLLALHRENEKLITNLEALIQRYVDSVTSSRGGIGDNTRISHCGVLKNIRIGASAVLEGVSSLENGTILSKPEAPTRVGAEVIADDFIFATDSIIQNGVNLSCCFVGQATELGREYSAENSVFFANCAGFHGEACSIFAGPYTVTHHKSTLLIAGIYSFLNAGSGSNQSNHMYKLGPVHQGIMERGSKTSSDSYMLWPMRVGPFSLVMGRHYGNADTSKLPFSYLIEQDGESNLVPAVNLRSVGTIRDTKKWPRRDKRKDPEITDHIIFHLLTPYTGERMLQGIELLETIRDTAGHSSRNFYINGVKIQRSSLEKGIDLYRLGLRRYLGNVVVNILRHNPIVDIAEIRQRFQIPDEARHGYGEWVDWAGLYFPKAKADSIINKISNEQGVSLDDVNLFFRDEYERYEAYEVAWVDGVMRNQKKKGLMDFTTTDFSELIEDWIDAVESLDRMRWSDAKKEFTQTSRIGYGIDDPSDSDADFLSVRGSAAQNAFILELKDRLSLKKQSAAEMVEALNKLKS